METFASRSEPHYRALRDEFEALGSAGPFRVMDNQMLHILRRRYRDVPPPADWEKGFAATSQLFFALATQPAILDRVAAILGDDIMLWGASVLRRRPGQVHHWHTDLETSKKDGRTVSVWIGLSNTSRLSSLQLITRSHKFGISIQERATEAAQKRNATGVEDALRWAQEYDPESTLVIPDMADGEAIFFDGRLWHGSDNTSSKVRRAILLQFAAPDVPIRMPFRQNYEWPFRFHDTPPYPPCIMVRGSDRFGVNRTVPPPGPTRSSQPVRPALSSRIEPLTLPLEGSPEKGWRPHPLFRGTTHAMKDLACHVSVLNPGVRPHPPHQHEDEEILLVLAGEADLVIPDQAGNEQRERVTQGDFVYYPSWQHHTLECTGKSPVTYLMFKWTGTPADRNDPLTYNVYRVGDKPDAPSGQNGWRVTRLFEGPTKHLWRLHAHVSRLEPGAGYPAHTDAYDVAIVLLRGAVKTLGERVEPHGVVFYAAGEPHGMESVGDESALYVVFEFHAGPEPITRAAELRSVLKRLFRRLPGPVRALAGKGLQLVRR